MEKLILDCENGARKDSIANQLCDLLSPEEAESFVDRFNAAGLPGARAELVYHRDTPHAAFQITKDGLTESDYAAPAHEHHARKEVEDTICTLHVSDQVKKDACAVYDILARAEAKAHNTTPDTVHFHEVGNTFALGYIVATCMLIEQLAPQSITATPLTCGYGFVECAHGRLPIPAPATANILENLPHQPGDVEGELCTPTGAALVAHFASAFEESPQV